MAASPVLDLSVLRPRGFETRSWVGATLNPGYTMLPTCRRGSGLGRKRALAASLFSGSGLGVLVGYLEPQLISWLLAALAGSVAVSIVVAVWTETCLQLQMQRVRAAAARTDQHMLNLEEKLIDEVYQREDDHARQDGIKLLGRLRQQEPRAYLMRGNVD